MFYKNSESKSLDHSILFLLKILLFYKGPNYISNPNSAYANIEAEIFNGIWSRSMIWKESSGNLARVQAQWAPVLR